MKRRSDPSRGRTEDHSELYLPEIQKRSRRRRRLWFLAGALAFVLAAMLAGAYAVAYSPLLQVREFKVENGRSASEEEILSFLRAAVVKGSFWKQWLGPSNILVWPDALPEADLASFPMLRRVSIAKSIWGKSVSVEVEERKVFGVWCLGRTASCFWFDDKGVLIARAPQVSGSLILKVDDLSQDLSPGSPVLPRGLENAFSVFRVLQDSGLPIREIRLEDLGLSELKVFPIGGPVLYFSLRFPADSASAVLNSLRDSDPSLSKLEYIDFRVENRAYYK